MNDRAWFGPHHIYRCFDGNGALLYLGCTSKVKRRIKAHRLSSPWFAQVVRVETEGPYRRGVAYATELVAIRAEQPRYNVRHKQPTPGGDWSYRTALSRSKGGAAA